MTVAIDLTVVRVVQPIGEIYVGSITSDDLWKIAEFDIREIQKNEDGIYLATGIQRKLSESRVSEIAEYVKTVDATFPTAVILAVSSDCVKFTSKGTCLKMHLETATEKIAGTRLEDELFSYDRFARVIDGQHRIAGLKEANKTGFEVNVAIFVDADIEDQARVFATVNLAQTKVSKSLVYDLFSYSTKPSPEKMAHSICLSLDQTEGSPFFERIKRLGTATPGRMNQEPLSQATVVEGILSHIVASKEQLIRDRDLGRRGKQWTRPDTQEARKLVLRPFFVEGRDVDAAELLWNYFEAVQKRWPSAWEVGGVGEILARTNGYRALMRFFRHAYNRVSGPGEMVQVKDFSKLFKNSELEEDEFTTDYYPPGTSGETRLFHDLLAMLS